MPIQGCFCYSGENSPEYEYYCPCQGKGDRAHYDKILAAQAPLLDKANDAYYGDDEQTAWDLIYDAYSLACKMNEHYERFECKGPSCMADREWPSINPGERVCCHCPNFGTPPKS